jgi:hypothetical protein
VSIGKYIKYAVIGIFLVIGILIANYFINQERAKRAYVAAQKRCGRSDPIVIRDRLVSFSGDTNGIIIELGASFPDPGQRYYCTLTEAINDGHWDEQQINREAPENIKKLYP